MHCICCLVLSNSTKTQALLDLGSEVNTMTFVFADKLGFFAQKIIIEAQKIDGLILKTFKMVILGFLLYNNIKKI